MVLRFGKKKSPFKRLRLPTGIIDVSNPTFPSQSPLVLPSCHGGVDEILHILGIVDSILFAGIIGLPISIPTPLVIGEGLVGNFHQPVKLFHRPNGLVFDLQAFQTFQKFVANQPIEVGEKIVFFSHPKFCFLLPSPFWIIG